MDNPRWLELGEAERLIPIAAKRFNVPEDDVTAEMVFAVARVLGRLKQRPE